MVNENLDKRMQENLRIISKLRLLGELLKKLVLILAMVRI